MKTIAILFLSVLLISVNLIGQSHQGFDNPKHNQYNPNKERLEPNLMDDDEVMQFEKPIIINKDVLDLWRIDSTINYYFPEGLDSIPWGRRIYLYDNINNTIDNTFQRLNDSSVWENQDRNLLTFNDKNQQTQLIYFNWNSYQETWTNDRKTDYIYDNNDNLLERATYDWKQDQWVGNIKFVHVYNSNGDEILQTNYNWDVVNNVWIKTSKYEHYYNSQGLKYRSIGYTSNSGTGNLKLLYKDSISFNNLNLVTSRYFYYWNDSSLNWDNYDRDIFTYDGDYRSSFNDYWQDNAWKHWSKGIEYKIDSIKDGYNGYSYRGDSAWFHNRKYERIIDEFGNTILYESYIIPDGYDSWIGDSKQYKIFNEIGQITETYYYDWDYWNEEWVNSLNYKNGYNDDGIHVYNSEYLWEVNNWVKYTSRVFYFSNISTVNESYYTNIPIQVYPNPCAKQIKIDFEGTEKSKAVFKIYTLSGRIMDEGEINFTNTVDVSKLRRGYYLIKLESGNKIFSGRFLKL